MPTSKKALFPGTNACIFVLVGISFLACNSNQTSNNKSGAKDSSQIDSLLTIAEKLTGSNTDQAYLYLKTARKYILNESNMLHLSRYHIITGRIAYYEDKYLLSVQHLDSARQILEKTAHEEVLAKTYSFLCASHAQMGNYPVAIKYCLDAISIREKLNQPEALAGCYNFLGNIYLEQEDHKQAIKYNDMALQLSRSDSISPVHANVLSTRGGILKSQNELKKAEHYLTKAYDIRIKCAYIRHIASSLSQLADLRYMQKNYKEAKELLADTEQIYTELNEKTGLFKVYYLFTRIYSAEENMQMAMQYAEKAYESGKEINSKRHLAKATQSLFELYEKAGDPVTALEFYKENKEYTDQLNSLEQSRIIANLEYNYELEQGRKDNEILTQKNKIRKQQTSYLLIISLALIVIIVALFIMIRLKNKNLRHNHKLLLNEKKMAEATRKLHHKEKIILENDLELKNKELTSKTIELLHQIETLQALSEKIENLRQGNSREEVEGILHELNMKTRESVWDEFHAAFNQVHNEFYDRLFEYCPDLSSTEIKIAALLKLNLSTKEIAAISYKSESAVKTARHRLRQKLNLNAGDSLINFLMRI